MRGIVKLLTVVEHFETSFFLTWKANNFGNRFFSLWNGAKSGWIWESIDLLDQLEGDEVENEGLLDEHNDHHVLSEFDIHDELVGVESDLCPILLLMVIPNYNLISLLLVHENDYICLVHHLHQCYVLIQILHLFLEAGTTRIVLQNLESCVCGNCEIFLILIRANAVHLSRRVCVSTSCDVQVLLLDGFLMRLLVLLHNLVVNEALFGWDHVSSLVCGELRILRLNLLLFSCWLVHLLCLFL